MRLLRLLELNAPRIVIARECRLVCEAFDGGMWQSAWQCLIQAWLRAWEWRITIPFYRLACRLGIWHLGQTNGDGCPFCGKGEPEGWDDNGCAATETD